MDDCKKTILGYQVSDTKSTAPCILALRMAFDKFKEFTLTQVIGLTNDDPVSKEFRWVKQVD